MELDEIIVIERRAEKGEFSEAVGVGGLGHVVGGTAGLERSPSDAVANGYIPLSG